MEIAPLEWWDMEEIMYGICSSNTFWSEQNEFMHIQMNRFSVGQSCTFRWIGMHLFHTSSTKSHRINIQSQMHNFSENRSRRTVQKSKADHLERLSFTAQPLIDQENEPTTAEST